MNSEADGEIKELDLEIAACEVCRSHVDGYSKPNRLYRGIKSTVMIVGQAPGKTELTSAKPFSGQSGKRLDDWLISSGADPTNPRALVYCTSVVKCFTPDPKHLPLMVRNCRPFLFKQMKLVRPSLVITLGQKAYDQFRLQAISFESALCKSFLTSEYTMFTDAGYHYEVLVWPHPSGLNRWHNEPNSKNAMKETFKLVQKHILR